MKRESGGERRRKGPTRIPQLVRVRPSQPQRQDFDEILPTQNISRNSIYFSTLQGTYYEGMRLFVTYPYSTAPGAINRDFLSKVVRVDQLSDGKSGVAVELLMPIYLGTGETIRRRSGEWY